MSECLNIWITPSQDWLTTIAAPSLSSITAVFADNQTVLLYLHTSGDDSSCGNTSVDDPSTWKSTCATQTHAIQECKQQNKVNQQKGTKADTCHVRVDTFPHNREHNTFVDAPSTLRRKKTKKKCLSFSKATISSLKAGMGEASWVAPGKSGKARLGWAVQCKTAGRPVLCVD